MFLAHRYWELQNRYTIKEKMDNYTPSPDDPISEVGSVPLPAFSEVQWRAVLEMQNRNFAELAKIVQASPSREQQHNHDVVN